MSGGGGLVKEFDEVGAWSSTGCVYPVWAVILLYWLTCVAMVWRGWSACWFTAHQDSRHALDPPRSAATCVG
jgi:hypothetical protein